MRDQQNPLHFINLEKLGGQPLPPTRSDFIRLVAERSRSEPTLGASWTQASIGFLPYALAESTQLLATIFKQLRVDPSDRRLQLLALHYAGVLGHYSADLCQPLHTTIHYDGRALPSGESSRTGFHDLVDRLIETVPASTESPRTASSSRKIEPSDLFAAIVDELAKSHGLVDRVYGLEDDISRGVRRRAGLGKSSPTSSANDFQGLGRLLRPS